MKITKNRVAQPLRKGQIGPRFSQKILGNLPEICSTVQAIIGACNRCFRSDQRNASFRSTFRSRSAAVPQRLRQKFDREGLTTNTTAKDSVGRAALWPGATPCGRAFWAPKRFPPFRGRSRPQRLSSR